LLAAMDATIEIARDGERRSARLAKSKDGKDGTEHEFRLEVLNLGQDEDGEAITSCVVVPQFHDRPGKRERIPSGRNQKIAWAAIKPLFAGGAPGATGAPEGSSCAELDAALQAVASSLTCSPERRPERARAAIDGLIGNGLLGHREGFLWRM
jgi:putative DNA primase/helicase